MIPAIAHHNVVDSDDQEEDGTLMKERVKMSECHAILKDRSYRREGGAEDEPVETTMEIACSKGATNNDVHKRRGG